MSNNVLEFGVLFSANNLSEFDPEKLSEKEDNACIIGNEEVWLSFIIDENNIAVSSYLDEDYEMKVLTLPETKELIRSRKEFLEELGFSVNEDSAEIYYSHYYSGTGNRSVHIVDYG